MAKRNLLVGAILMIGLLSGCSSDDEVVVPPADLYEARGDISNFLVGDGTIDTRMSVRLSANVGVADNILPNQTSLDESFLLGSDNETVNIGISLTHGDGTILNDGEEFTLIHDRRYLYIACGLVSEASGTLKPTLLKMTPLAKPGAGKVQFRFIHALAGNPVAVDVHVNGEVISNVSYGAVSAPVIFTARPVGQDELLVVPTGVTPDGSNEIFKSTGHLLFFMDEHYDGVLAHHPKSIYDGDVNGQAALVRIQSPY
jgi:hypothetical protein